MTKSIRTLLVGFVAGLLLLPATLAQTAQIRGQIVDSTGAAVPGASITVRNVAAGLTRETVSN